MKLKIVSFDISMSNLGAAVGIYDTDTEKLVIDQAATFCPTVSESKQVRQNSKDLDKAKQLFNAALKATKGADIVCAELPVGSQNARASTSYGMCLGVMGALTQSVPVLIEVSPLEVKQVVGNKKATKKEVIAWVQKHHPEAPLSMHRGVINESKAEHQADAIVAIHAAIRTPTFKAMQSFAKGKI